MLQTIDDYLADYKMPAEHRLALSDGEVKKLVVDEARGANLHEFILLRLHERTERFSDNHSKAFVPVMQNGGIDGKTREAVESLRSIKNKILEHEQIAVVAGTVWASHDTYPEFEASGQYSVYLRLVKMTAEKIEALTSEYYALLESCKDQGFIKRKGILAGLGNLATKISGSAPYLNGKQYTPQLWSLLTSRFWLFRAVNSHWSIIGTDGELATLHTIPIHAENVFRGENANLALPKKHEFLGSEG